MTVVTYEPPSRLAKDSFCLSSDGLILQVNEGILNELESDRDESIDWFAFYYAEMEKIDASASPTDEAVALDTYFGSLGLPEEDNYTVKNNNRKYYGIC